jgi:hypothetical protein
VHPDLPRPKVSLLPVFYLPGPNGELEAVVDSTPIIRRLEREQTGRSVIPEDAVIGFLNDLLEDYGDEWLTKLMFHYRWHFAADIENAGNVLPLWADIGMSGDKLARMSKEIAERQISRLYVVGSNEITAPIIEDSYRRYLDIMSRHLQVCHYTLGNRPGSCDFAAYGQLTQLTQVDPTPIDIARREGPRVVAWTGIIEDLSGLEPKPGDWITRDAIPHTLRELLAEMGRTYVPVMLANARALRSGAAKVESKVEGKPWVQEPFPYQGKCVVWLREAYAALKPEDRSDLDRILAGTGCEPLFRD